MLDGNKKMWCTAHVLNLTYRHGSSPEVLPISLYQHGLLGVTFTHSTSGAAALCAAALPVPAAACPSGHCWDTAPHAKRVFGP